MASSSAPYHASKGASSLIGAGNPNHPVTFSGSARTLNLQSADLQVKAFREGAVMRSRVIRNMMIDFEYDDSSTIPIQRVSMRVLMKVMEYCAHHENDPSEEASKNNINAAKSVAAATVAAINAGVSSSTNNTTTATTASTATDTATATATAGGVEQTSVTNVSEEIERPSHHTFTEWDHKYIEVEQELLFEIIMAANYLDIPELLELGCYSVAQMIKGKNPEEIRKLFNIENDFTPEESEQIAKENSWVDEH